MSEETIENMRERIQRCRRLAKATTDERTAEALLQIEADVRQLEARGGF